MVCLPSFPPLLWPAPRSGPAAVRCPPEGDPRASAGLKITSHHGSAGTWGEFLKEPSERVCHQPVTRCSHCPLCGSAADVLMKYKSRRFHSGHRDSDIQIQSRVLIRSFHFEYIYTQSLANQGYFGTRMSLVFHFKLPAQSCSIKDTVKSPCCSLVWECWYGEKSSADQGDSMWCPVALLELDFARKSCCCYVTDGWICALASGILLKGRFSAPHSH